MKTCIKNEFFRCLYVNNTNYIEFLKEAFPEYDTYDVSLTDSSIKIRSIDTMKLIRLYEFGWYVEEVGAYSYPYWQHYNDKEFQSKYKIY